ncbi:PTS sugar transporter subunit IIA [Brevibacillus massiliensis]|jgi:PTS system galactitol-specific IIA component|uniref:PTS sugar transporter subunit IIA n=1 Tax=Brevibacillus massiliensis TaxID=1118054 RepID=UPI000304AA8C|nr:PTS sugar transporter subunit IIA [Brevibacillus massiliensis]
MTRQLHFEERLVEINVVRETKEEVITMLAHLLKEQGYVKDSFLTALLEREKVYSTGLPLKKYGVAIPHTDVVHVNEPAIAVAILDKPVQFQMMGSPETDVMADIVFVLAVKEPSEQIFMLESLMNLFQNDELMDTLKHATSRQEAMLLIKRELGLSAPGEVSPAEVRKP